MRMHQQAWELLKSHKQIKVELRVPVDSQRKARVIKAYKKAISKEKHRDVPYKIKQPNAKLESSYIDTAPYTVIISFVLLEIPEAGEI